MAKLYNLARMTTTTTGTGTITLGSAVAGYLTFAQSGVADGDVVDYAIKDGNDSEIGTGTYTSSGTTLTRTVTKSTNSNAAISLSGAAEVFITPRAETLNDASLLTTGTVGTARLGSGTANSSTVLSGASQWVPAREILTANRTYYVRTDGSDSNNGLSNTSGGAFLTIQKAWNTILTLDLAGNTVTIQLADGTYTAGLSISAPALGGTVILNGNSSTPTNVVISTTICVSLSAPGSAITVQNLRLSGSDICLAVQSPGSQATIGPGMSFAGSPSRQHINISQGKVQATTNGFTIASGGGGWLQVAQYGVLETADITITFSGTPAWTNEGINSATGLVSLWNTTISGSATGKRYSVSANGFINSFGAGTSSSYFPGSVNGSSGTGGGQN